MKFLLASASPRRRELLASAGQVFAVFSPDIDESKRTQESPKQFVRRLAREKAAAASAHASTQDLRWVLAADTTVALGARVLNKPVDDAEAKRMLRALSGKEHEVHTGVALFDTRSGRAKSIVITTRVSFRVLSRADIDRYVASGEPRDKAGAYGIQGLGGSLVHHVGGSYTNVIGLPLPETLALLRSAK